MRPTLPQQKLVLFDYVISEHEEVAWHFNAEELGGLEIDDEFEFAWLLNRNIAGLGTVQNLVDKLGGAAE